MYWFLVGILIIVGVIVTYKYKRTRLYESLKTRKFNPMWINILNDNLSLYTKLTDDQKYKLHGLINIFLHEKEFSGYNGLVITDEIRVTIAAQACLLLLNRDGDLYPSLKNIFVYPDAFKSMQPSYDGTIKIMRESIRVGESWHLGHVVLSWFHSKKGGRNDHDGQNVVYHEFAHQLDHQDGAIDGTPILDTTDSYKNWSVVFSTEFDRLRKKVNKHQKTLIDSYGSLSEGEFFAVATELFFEKPKLFEREHPKLYNELRNYYHLNPSDWF